MMSSRIMRMRAPFFCSLFFFGLCFFSSSIMSTLSAVPLAIGGAVGADFPLSHRDKVGPGISAEGFYRLDPYEVRFHYGHIDNDMYSVVLAMKHFFSEGVVRPYLEGAFGPVIVDTSGRGLAYGVKPEVTIGTDLGITENFSTGLVTRYWGAAYFGSTDSGKFEANHGFSILGNVILWF